MRKWICLLLIVFINSVALTCYGEIAASNPAVNLTPQVLNKIGKKFGKKAKKRLVDWLKLIKKDQNVSTSKKLIDVNDFFNKRIMYAQDSLAWKVQDYWATPLEFLIRGAGDCEDFAIAKYFTLRALKVPEAKMEITYVYLTRHSRGANPSLAHMVLSYYPNPAATPYILDNLIDNILPANKRPGLKPIYSFNGTSLWIEKLRERGVVGSSQKLSKWANLNKRTLKRILTK